MAEHRAVDLRMQRIDGLIYSGPEILLDLQAGETWRDNMDKQWRGSCPLPTSRWEYKLPHSTVLLRWTPGRLGGPFSHQGWTLHILFTCLYTIFTKHAHKYTRRSQILHLNTKLPKLPFYYKRNGIGTDWSLGCKMYHQLPEYFIM